MGGKFHLKLNNGERPIANKYREGKMKRTLKRELKVLEIATREALHTSVRGVFIALGPRTRVRPVGNSGCARRKGGRASRMPRQSRSIRRGGEGCEKGRRAISV